MRRGQDRSACSPPRSPSPRSPAARSSRRQPVEPARRRAARAPALGRDRAQHRAEETVHPDFGSGRYEGRPIGIPYQVVARDAKRTRVRFEYADESDRGPYPIPRQPADRGRRRPPHADGPARHVPAVRAVRGAARGSGWTRRDRARSSTCARTRCARAAGRAPTPPACRSSPASRATTRSRRARSATRCASRSRARGARSSSRRATSRRRSPTPTCPRWASGCG